MWLSLPACLDSCLGPKASMELACTTAELEEQVLGLWFLQRVGEHTHLYPANGWRDSGNHRVQARDTGKPGKPYYWPLGKAWPSTRA